jgi:uncharacterized protein (TIGR03086 family)
MTAPNKGVDRSDADHAPEVHQLARAFAAVDDLIAGIRPEQWSAPTPCSEWTVRQLIAHLIGMNRVFIALLDDEPMPRRAAAPVEADLVGAFRDSAATLQAAFDRPGVLQRTYSGPLGAATGAERLQIRLYDLLAHGWDLAQATGQPAALPEDLAEQALAFVRSQPTDQARPGRFAPAQRAADTATGVPIRDQSAGLNHAYWVAHNLCSSGCLFITMFHGPFDVHAAP